MSHVLDEHRQYLEDEPRMRAFRRAIGEVVKPGDVVVDLGAGTGIMGVLACQAGAQRVYVIEETDLIELTRDIYRANGCDDRAVFIKDLSTRVTLPEPADVVVADQVGYFGFDAGICEYFSDARARFLKPRGRMIPSAIDLVVAPVEHADIRTQVEFWSGTPAGFDLAPARALAANARYLTKFGPEHLIGEPAVLTSLDLSRPLEPWLGLTAAFPATRRGMLHGIGGWFSAHLSKGIDLTNSPKAVDRINRYNVFFPIDRPVALAPHDVIEINMSILPAETLVKWDVTVSDPSGSRKDRFSHSTFHGLLLSKDHLQKTRPDFAPKLHPWGEAERSILDMCDGTHTLKDIEKEVYRRHQDIFRSPQEASRLVCEVTARHTR